MNLGRRSYTARCNVRVYIQRRKTYKCDSFFIVFPVVQFIFVLILWLVFIYGCHGTAGWLYNRLLCERGREAFDEWLRSCALDQKMVHGVTYYATPVVSNWLHSVGPGSVAWTRESEFCFSFFFLSSDFGHFYDGRFEKRSCPLNNPIDYYVVFKVLLTLG
jgi:hypothetical protein